MALTMQESSTVPVEQNARTDTVEESQTPIQAHSAKWKIIKIIARWRGTKRKREGGKQQASDEDEWTGIGGKIEKYDPNPSRSADRLDTDRMACLVTDE